MKIGLLCGREYSFPPAFLDRVNTLGEAHGITAEFVKLTGTTMGEPSGYQVIVDRISHEVEYFRAYLKHAVLEGTYVINNPFWWTADDKFFNYSVARKLGVAVPKTQKPMVDMEKVRMLDPVAMRGYIPDGNYGGLYERSDADTLALWQVAVEETRAMLDGAWGGAS